MKSESKCESEIEHVYGIELNVLNQIGVYGIESECESEIERVGIGFEFMEFLR
jgi:hypothetical protein